MVNPYYVQPLGGLDLGATYTNAVQRTRGEEEKAAAKNRQQEAIKMAQQAYASGDPDQIAQVSLQYPELASQLNASVGFKNELTRQNMISSLREGVANPSRIPELIEKRVALVEQQGGDPTETRAELERYNADPEGYVNSIKQSLALIDPKGYKAYMEATGGAKSGTPTKLQKLFELKDSLPPGDPRLATVDAAIAKESTRGKGTAFSINPDGTINFSQGDVDGVGLGSGKDLDKKLSEQDAKQVQASREASGKAEQSRSLLNRARELLPELNTGKGAEVTKLVNQALSTLGSEASEGRAALYEEFDALSKELGAQTLQLFGGSDTEKELEVAIRTNPELSKTNTANDRIIRRKLRAIETLQQRPDFESQWLQRNGSLVNPDASTGEYFGRAWRRFQAESFGDSVEPETVTTKAEYDALPSGALFIEDGKQYRKP